ncbi:hypothetical protein TrST_g3481 [Triparma strigata]|uniref:polyribonucleotide nucleotidyltransferase n=1 Tax=Triparma strigata TaxID=1606541 RepID=A0A9W7B2B1_9STRA|nr:hypothetical protein TrST_g3481 [Triparma strigata]
MYLLPLQLSLLLLPLTSSFLLLPQTFRPYTSQLRAHTITTSTDRLKNKISTLTVDVGDDVYKFETGGIGRQASRALTLTRNTNSIIYSTTCRSQLPTDKDFLPLSIDYQTRFSSAGLTSGGYNKRDGRPSELEILVSRIIDRPLRPLIDSRWKHDTQVLSWVLSYGGGKSLSTMAICVNAASVYLSDVPMKKAVAGVMVGYVNETFVINPSREVMEESLLELVVAGTEDAVLMIEGAAEFLSEEIMIEAIEFGHAEIKKICVALEEFKEHLGVERYTETLEDPDPKIDSAVSSLMSSDVDAAYKASTKSEQVLMIDEAYRKVVEVLEPDFPNSKNHLKKSLKTLFEQKMYHLAKTTGGRVDGRSLSEVRPLDVRMGMLPRVHGSSLFTRGETQALATTTLGDKGMAQKIDSLDGGVGKRFYLQYTFPPSCVGETGRVGAPGRREIGHGNLAERALVPTIPSEADFPYTIRVESLITESHGSSSMASVCGGCLSLMDAGVPVKEVVAGIAMGALMENADDDIEDAIVLTDLMGIEDALGMMDFKVAGSRDGISTFQLDTKCEGLTVNFMRKALEQAKIGRIHILDAMVEYGGKVKEEMPDTVPKMRTFKIESGSIGKVIGPGGKQIRAIIEDFELGNMDVGEEGEIQISGFNATKLGEVEEFVKKLVEGGGGARGGGGREREPKKPYDGPEPVEGETYSGKVTGVHAWGVFLEIMPGLEGLCHVSELHTERVRSCEGFVSSLGEGFDVKYLGKNDKGQLQLSRKQVMDGGGGGGGGGGRGRGGDRGGDRGGGGRGRERNRSGRERAGDEPEKGVEMPQAEIDVIEAAISSTLE